MGPRKLQTILVQNLLFLAVSYSHVAPYATKYYKQTLDHFNFGHNFNTSSFQQRYLLQDKWWNPGKGPIFFYTGNEGPITAFWEGAGLLCDLAPQFQALVVFAEHRYYGESVPFGADLSFQQPYVHLLTVEQALADFATLVVHLKETLNASTSPVIAFGGSYGGILSAYMRYHYPNIIVGSIAASAPMLGTVDLVSRDYFFKDVTDHFSKSASNCDNKVKEAFKLMDMYAHQGSAGMKKISDAFPFCEPVSTMADVEQVVGWIRNAFANLAMFDYPYPIGNNPAWPVKVACEKLVSSKDVLGGLAKASLVYYGKKACHKLWEEYMACSDPTGCGTGPDGKAWSYQACTEMIMPAGTNNVTDMFPVLPFTLDQRDEFCQKEWNVTPRNKWLQISMWGRDIKHTSNIVFSNGDLDPWHNGGVLENVSDSIVAVMIKDGAHHLDLRAPNKDDPPSVINARKLEVHNIQKWITEDRFRK